MLILTFTGNRKVQSLCNLYVPLTDCRVPVKPRRGLVRLSDSTTRLPELRIKPRASFTDSPMFYQLIGGLALREGERDGEKREREKGGGEERGRGGRVGGKGKKRETVREKGEGERGRGGTQRERGGWS